MEELVDFLKNREVDDATIQIFIDQKIDCQALQGMKEPDLKTLIPKYGDRMAVIDFAQRKISPLTAKKKGLLDRLRRRLKRKKTDSDSDDDTSSEQTTRNKIQSLKKNDRQIELGWMNLETDGSYKQVRTKQGGGTRRVRVKNNSKKEELIEIGKILFFPSGISSKGRIDRFNFELFDFKRNELPSELSVEDVVLNSGISKIRFYLATVRKQASATVTSEQPDTSIQPPLATNEKESTNLPELPLSTNFELNLSPESELQRMFFAPSTPPFDTIEGHSTSQSVSEQLQPFDYPTIDGINTSDAIDPIDYPTIDGIDTTDAVDLVIPIDYPIIDDIDKVDIVVHRGQILHELIKIFSKIDIKKCGKINASVVLPNGESEVAQDHGGVFRDILSEFWNDFYEMCTIGTNAKVPCLRHDYGSEQWKAVARILYIGWRESKYLPLKLSIPFLQSCLTATSNNIPTSEITESFLQFINENDRVIIKKALNDYTSVEEDEIIDVLSEFDSKWIPTKDNFHILINDIGHRELLQKPAFIIQAWQEELKDIMIVPNLHELYKSLLPTPRNVLSNLDPPCDLGNGDMFKVYGYLKKFLREADEAILSAFLRFCTGADVLNPDHKITVGFNGSIGFGRMPIGHTCSRMLELPTTYDTYPCFRTELKSVLTSKIWVMDLL